MPTLDTSPYSDRFEFGAAVRSRSWEWLLALRRRLNIDLQITDDALTPLLGLAASPIAADLETLLTSGMPGLRLAVSTAIRKRTPQAASVDDVQTVTLPLTMGRSVSGALVIARRTADDVLPDRVRGELELIGIWLANAIEAHLLSPPAAEGDLERVSSLCRLLGGSVQDDGPARAGDRELVAAFAEALAVWHDLEVSGYIETSRGEFVRDVTLPGADPEKSPAAIPRASLPDSPQVAPLSKADVERLGFQTAGELVVARLADGVGSWLVAISGAMASHHELTRLSLYLALLEQAIVRAIHASTSHAVLTMAKHLLDEGQDAEEQVRRAVHELQEALGAPFAALTVAAAGGAPLVRIGAERVVGTPGAASDAPQVIVRRAPEQYTMTMIVEWPAGSRVMLREERMVHAAADLIEPWVRRLVRQEKRVSERRASSRSFDEVLDRFARQALDSGVPVTAVVLASADAMFRPDITQTRIGRIREHVRPSDLVGRLGDGEIGILLHDAAGAPARIVTSRVRRLLEAVDPAPVSLSVGLASRAPGEPHPDQLAQEARQNATRHDGEESADGRTVDPRRQTP